MTSSVIEDRDKLISEYEKLIDRLEKAEKWANDNNYAWEFVKAHKYKIWHERDNIIKEIEFVRELLNLKYQEESMYKYEICKENKFRLYIQKIEEEFERKYESTGKKPNAILLSENIFNFLYYAYKNMFGNIPLTENGYYKVMGLDVIIVEEDYRIECIRLRKQSFLFCQNKANESWNKLLI